MKTRIIQNEPEEPAKNGQTADVSVAGPRRNLAARMGRWSAGHKKTAIFGWLAFIAVAFLIGNAVGTKQLDQNKVGTGESGHVDSVLRDEFKQAQGDQILIQSTTKTVDDPAFRAAIAAGLPLLLALTAVFATIGLLAVPSQLIPLDKDVTVIVLLIGLAVGVDYSLFYLKREREERAAGRSERAALEAAAATSGRS